MGNREFSLLSVAVVTMTLTGCARPTTVGAEDMHKLPQDGMLSVRELAARLGLHVADTGRASVELSNAANMVLIFTHTSGRTYVNSVAVGRTGKTTTTRGVVYVRGDLEAAIRPMLRAAPSEQEKPEQKPEPQPLRGRRVVIDPGHGGKDPGAPSCLGYHEKSVNLAVGRDVARRLGTQGAAATLTREGDTFLELGDRAALANRLRADLFVSIHADSCNKPSVRGFTVYVARAASARSRSAARAIASAMTATGLSSRGVQEANFQVLVGTTCPAVLIEMGYLSNTQDAALLRDAAFQGRMAEAITSAISVALGSF